MADSDLGTVTRKVLADIAGAIRAQTGSAARYTPPEMAEAILSIQPGPKTYYGLLLEDGTLELCYRAQAASALGTVSQAYEADLGGYTLNGHAPWYERRGEIVRCVMDTSLRLAPITSAAFLLDGMNAMKSVEGFENLQHAGNFNYLFYNCKALVSVFATEFDTAKITSKDSTFTGCNRLVGGHGKTRTAIEKNTDFSLGEAGLLTDPDADQRRWIWCTVYEDGELVLSATDATEASRPYLLHDQACANVTEASAGTHPWSDVRAKIKRATISPDIAGIDGICPESWFSSHASLASVTGMGYLRGVTSLSSVFSTCTSITEVDLRGLDSTKLKKASSTFYGCGKLQKILASPDWVLPAGVTGYNTFLNCSALVGGNGTTYSSSHNNYDYLRLDLPGSPGYLTASS